MSVAPLTDQQLEAVLGAGTGEHAPTLEELAAHVADDFRLRADYHAEAWAVVTPFQLRQAAALLDALVALSREGDGA